MNEAVESLCVSENDDETLRGRCAHRPCKDRQGVKEAGVPAKVPGAFVVDLVEETGWMDRGEAELLMSWFECPDMVRLFNSRERSDCFRITLV